MNTDDKVAPRPWTGHMQMSRDPKTSALLVSG